MKKRKGKWSTRFFLGLTGFHFKNVPIYKNRENVVAVTVSLYISTKLYCAFERSLNTIKPLKRRLPKNEKDISLRSSDSLFYLQLRLKEKSTLLISSSPLYCLPSSIVIGTCVSSHTGSQFLNYTLLSLSDSC